MSSSKDPQSMGPGHTGGEAIEPAALPRKRFVAGAVCPRCGVQDRIRSWDTDDGRQCRDCVECGFEDSMAAAPPDAVVPGRLDEPRPSSRGAAQPLRFFPRPRRAPGTGGSAPAADDSGDGTS